MTKDEALTLALEALEVEQIEVQIFRLVPKPHLTNAITVLREALAKQPAQQEPVAVRLWDSQWVNVVNHDNCYRDWSKEDAINHAVKMTEKYIAGNVADNKLPPAQKEFDNSNYLTIAYMDGVQRGKELAQRTWVGLTHEEHMEIMTGTMTTSSRMAAVEAALRSKNT